MEDVARRAGVSVMTVSRTFAEPGLVAPATRARVEAAAAALDFVPDRVAGALRSGTSRLVAAVVPALQDGLFATTLQGLADALRPAGYALAVAASGHDPEEEERIVTELLGLRPAGLVLHATDDHAPGLRRRVARAGLPVVETGDRPRTPLGLVTATDNRAASRLLTRHLLSTGRRRIAYATLPLRTSPRAVARLDGYRDAVLEAGLVPDPSLILEVPLGEGFEAGARCLAHALEAGADAMLGAGGVIALGALLAALRDGIAVPDRIAIAAYDDHPVGTMLRPELTCLAIPRREIGHAAGEVILARLGGGPAPPPRLFEARVKARGSA